MKTQSKLTIAIASLAMLASTAPSNALDVPFVGTVVSACALVIGTPGVFGISTAGDILSSKETGGLSGNLTATATSAGFDVSVASPVAFTAIPSGATATATFASTYSTSGATTTAETTEATATALNTGITIVSVDLEATKTSGIYSAGIYEAPVTVTCQ